MLTEMTYADVGTASPGPSPRLHGVHHTARPTWKLAETVAFYREVMGLKLVHAISARGWGPETHPDFLHFFFDAGEGSTIAFFYYLNEDKPTDSVESGSWLYNSVHTAWRVETEAQLMAWRERLETLGFKVMQAAHEIIESIYVTDPNGYVVEIAWQRRDISAWDAQDASLTLEAALQLEAEQGRRLEVMDEVWQRKSRLVDNFLAVAA
ncbi:VOC family protein [Polymorphobacter sp. PAMC 29334]|uniref:VOC family protein n=1 Tax=Polymorphobacter sp. PAMC 29334 TaxID=2862331 RepID=UPI001C74B861|nr:VOC family protein [Polymorphobacter sp. PAMC 29334]QYE36370.1 VOC family protein [Polymorphobacter sp. PAMC 29334]